MSSGQIISSWRNKFGSGLIKFGWSEVLIPMGMTFNIGCGRKKRFGVKRRNKDRTRGEVAWQSVPVAAPKQVFT
jgi:hypothetical protein